MNDVSKKYGNNIILSNISYEFRANRVYSIMGESGCGKSTLARLISGLEVPDAGEIYMMQRRMDKRLIKKFRKDIAIVFQDAMSSFNPIWKIGKSIEEPIKNFENLYKKEREKKVSDLLNQVELPKEYMFKYPNELSGGQIKRVAIARAIACNPKFIIFDEAFTGLDGKTKIGILSTLEQIKDKNKYTYVFITHDYNLAKSISDEVIYLENKSLKGIEL